MVQWWAEHEPSYLLILPFHHFFDADHFQRFADDYGAHLVRLSSSFKAFHDSNVSP